MIKIVTIIGARPQIIKSAAISRAIRTRFSNQIKEILVHTGQHYDENMSAVFFKEMQIPSPDYNLNVRSGTHGTQTAAMIQGIEEILVKENPDYTVVYGDTNSTLAAAIASSKIHIPVVHIEAGLRSGNKNMPEEINRILCDHVSTLLFCPTTSGVENLMKEGFLINNKEPYHIDNPKIFHCGDVMYDNSLFYSLLADKSDILAKHKLVKDGFALVTIHRDYNTDNPERLHNIFSTLIEIANSKNTDMVIPLHPRTLKLLSTDSKGGLYQELISNSKIKLMEPVSFLEMISLEKNSKLIMTDSGGVQKESYFFKKPCIILRSETEWVELAENGNAIVSDASPEKIIQAFHTLTAKTNFTYPEFYGDGKAAEFICEQLLANAIRK